MPIQNYTPQVIDRDGLEAAYVALNAGTIIAEEGNQFVNSGNEVLHVKNDNAAQITLTIITPGVVDAELAVSDRTIAIDAADEIFAGPWPTIHYGNPLQFQADVVASVTAAVLRSA